MSFLRIFLIPRADNIDKTVLSFMYPSEIQCQRQVILTTPLNNHTHAYVWALFNKSEFNGELEHGMNEIIIGGQLKSGRYYRATGYIWLIDTYQDLPQSFRRWKQNYRRWFRGKTDSFKDTYWYTINPINYKTILCLNIRLYSFGFCFLEFFCSPAAVM